MMWRMLGRPTDGAHRSTACLSPGRSADVRRNASFLEKRPAVQRASRRPPYCLGRLAWVSLRKWQNSLIISPSRPKRIFRAIKGMEPHERDWPPAAVRIVFFESHGAVLAHTSASRQRHISRACSAGRQRWHLPVFLVLPSEARAARTHQSAAEPHSASPSKASSNAGVTAFRGLTAHRGSYRAVRATLVFGLP